MIDVPVRDLRAGLQALCPGLIHELVPGCRREGNVWAAPNPTRANDSRSSFKIWGNGAWREYDEPEDYGKGDILGLVAYVAGFAPRSKEGRKHAIQWAKKRLGITDGNSDVIKKIRREAAARRKKADKDEAERAARIARRVADILIQSKGASHDGFALVRRYLLEARGIDYDAIPNKCPVLRWHSGLRHWGGANWFGPAMVAPAMNGDGFKTGLHATWLHDAGGVDKAPISQAKLMLGDIKGSVVPLTYGPSGLSTVEASRQGIRGPLVLCEGIETGLSLALALPEARVWAALSIGNIDDAPVWFDCISSIIVALENDLKPQALAQRDEVLEALARRGKPLTTMQAHQGNDFNDLLKGRV
ncbi:Toprim domain-containing protein [Rhodoblastus acidophilus]|uniref:Toprim domain-containing protein n=1 Tax=Rhodoblastus acidophilus TaxID=1074 RepID=A0A212RB58_RHOAC|nr:toprim domain-containing protein [Rhodoblastus acidophilus]PPQ39357.1 hypothetical protein CKO16_06275 [Rhodoblastus acidophilus]RAI22429.1 hypothetical protein CH337_05470 [Rhodoblastus acidophilus]SNB69328.1 Toprim domain-containing protein [Rhodoblastus acidophilus]